MAAAIQRAIREVDGLIARLRTAPPHRPRSPALAIPPHHSSKAPQTARNGPAVTYATESSVAPTAEEQQPKIAPASQQSGAPPLGEAFAKAKLRVARVTDVEEVPNSEKLYKCKVHVGAEDYFQVVAGLRRFITQDELQNRMVVVILNLKTAKLAGEVSEAMILAAARRTEGDESNDIVKPLQPPEGAEAGDPVFLQGSEPLQEFPKEFKQWKKMLPHLRVSASKATLDGQVLVTKAGEIRAAAELPDGSTIS